MAPPDETSPRRSGRVRTTVLQATSEEEQATTSKPKKKVKRIVKKTKVANKTTTKVSKEEEAEEELVDNNISGSDSETTPSPSKKRKATKVKVADASVDSEEEGSESKKPASKAKPKAKRASKKSSSTSGDEEEEPKQKKKKAPPHQVLTDKSEIPKLWNAASAPAGSTTLKIVSWNVAGLRAVIKKSPTVLADLVQQHDIDILCLQETKLQEQHLDDPKLNIPRLEAEGYQCFYSCSVAKKGYSGTAVFVRNRLGNVKKGAGGTKKSETKQQATMDQFFGSKAKAAPKKKTSDDTTSPSDAASDTNLPVLQDVSYKMGVDKHDAEGRMVILDFSSFSLCNVYVPNSGQKLERLAYRTDEWDKDFLSFMQQKQKDRGVPVLWLGDLNVAHTHLEVWNDGAKHLPKQAGVTPEERASFQGQLDSGFVDAFRRLHPTASGHYSYWSMRADNRPVNKGLRLDYFICAPQLFDAEKSRVVVRDSYMMDAQEGSDHCPVVLELEVKGSQE